MLFLSNRIDNLLYPQTENKRKRGNDMKPLLRQTLDVNIQRLGMHGEGVASIDGFTLFIPGALPGEQVKVQVIQVRKTFGRARLLKLLTPSPIRQIPACPVFGRCGGCQLMHLPYPDQLAFKTEKVKGDLWHIGGLKDLEVKPCLAAPGETAYRNKIEVPFGRIKERPVLGFYAPESHFIIPIDRCPVQCESGDQLFQSLHRLILNSGVQPYDERLHSPGIRHLFIKTSQKTGENLVTFITNGFEIPGLDELAKRILSENPSVKGIIQNNNPDHGNTILGPHSRLLAGQDYIEEEVAKTRFRIGALSFFQINTAQAETLVETVQTLLAPQAGETLLDVFCGAGLFSLCLGKSVSRVIGIENVTEAVELARLNADLNQVSQAEFILGSAEEVIRDISRADGVILDPPRKGCDPALLDALIKLTPKRIVYVSCNSATLARDLKHLSASRYQIDTIQPLDMFPQTSHVEVVAKLHLS